MSVLWLETFPEINSSFEIVSQNLLINSNDLQFTHKLFVAKIQHLSRFLDELIGFFIPNYCPSLIANTVFHRQILLQIQNSLKNVHTPAKIPSKL